jgi:hypothetical protein
MVTQSTTAPSQRNRASAPLILMAPSIADLWGLFFKDGSDSATIEKRNPRQHWGDGDGVLAGQFGGRRFIGSLTFM